MILERQFYAIAPTQFKVNGELDARATAQNIERATELGVERFLLAGAYGEFQSLDDDERVSLIDAVKDQCPSALVMIGAVHPSTDATQVMANRLLDAGADEVMVAAPTMSEVSESDILRHFEHLSTEVDGSLVLYNNAVFGHDVSPNLIAQLADFPSFSAVKQGTPSTRLFIESLLAAHQGTSGLRVLAASDVTAVITMAAGADGLTSTNFWAFPEAFLTLARVAGTDEHGLAHRVHEALVPYFELIRTLGQPRAIKSAMKVRGFVGSGMVRRPYVPLSDVDERRLEEVIRAVDVALADIDSGLGIRAS